MTTPQSSRLVEREPVNRACRFWHALPKGHTLEGEEWWRRHRGIVWLLWAHAVGVSLENGARFWFAVRFSEQVKDGSSTSTMMSDLGDRVAA